MTTGRAIMGFGVLTAFCLFLFYGYRPGQNGIGISQIPSEGIRFSGVYEGARERALEQKLAELFSHNEEIEKAYLVVAEYPKESSLHLTLCLRMQSGSSETPVLLAHIQNVFREVSGYYPERVAIGPDKAEIPSRDHLDILFITGERENEVQKLAAPFYIAALSAKESQAR